MTGGFIFKVISKDITEGGFHAHTPETRTTENKRITTSNIH